MIKMSHTRSGLGPKKFSIKSMYDHLTRGDNGPAFTAICKAKIPEKVKIFMWLTAQKAILTNDNMIKRNWQGTLVVTSAMPYKMWIISSFSVRWQR
jgi:hypothetical protein